MFQNFFKFVGVTDTQSPQSAEEFLQAYSGQTFLNGMYRLHRQENIDKWTSIITEAFPAVAGIFRVFGYDWLGRQFAIDSSDNMILLFEPGTGTILGIPVNFVDFHNSEIACNSKACLASDFFREWQKQNSSRPLPHDKCVGYKVPLFLNGNDDVDNLELSDMEVYWGLMGQLRGV